MLIPFDPFDLHILWWGTWRGHIASAYANPKEQDGYCHAACIAQMSHVTELALKINRLKKAGILKDE